MRDRLYWQVYPLGALDAEAVLPESVPVHHRLSRLLPWLDYLQDLGATGLALGPIFASQSHGYDTIDHFRIDPRLGDEEDFAALVRKAQQLDLAIILDGVFNHVGSGHPLFRQAVAEGQGSRYDSWFHIHSRDPLVYNMFEGQSQLPELNHGNPDVTNYIAEVMTHWLSRGAAGWRLDAAYAIDPHTWTSILPAVRHQFPHAYVVGEVIHGDYSHFVEVSGMDAVTQYELWKATWSSLNDQNFFELSWAMTRHNEFCDVFIPWTFIGNHDVTRIASQLSDPRHVSHALVLLMTLGGTPSIYYGDEWGATGVKENRLGGDNAIRPALPATPSDVPSHEYGQVYRALIEFRQQRPWLVSSRSSVEVLENRRMLFVSRPDPHSETNESVKVWLNLDDQEWNIHPEPQLLSSAEFRRDGQPDSHQTSQADAVPAHGWLITSG